MKARVVVTLLADIPDSQGETVAQAIADAGYDSVRSLRRGKVFDFEIEAEDQGAAHSMLIKISREVLVDLETEDFLVRVEAPPTPAGADRREDERRDDANRRDEDQRRSGRDRRDDAAAARGEERREGSDRRASSDRRSGDRRAGADRRAESDRREGSDRRSADDRRADQSDHDGPEKRSADRRSGERRGGQE